MLFVHCKKKTHLVSSFQSSLRMRALVSRSSFAVSAEVTESAPLWETGESWPGGTPFWSISCSGCMIAGENEACLS